MRSHASSLTGVALLLAILSCAPAPGVAPPGGSAPAPEPGLGATDPGPLPVPRPRPVAPPRAAFASGWMPLAATGVDRFLRRHPSYDGRGVLIAILDSGIDPGVPGLAETSTGRRKVLDLRDFSGEGDVNLEPVEPDGDSIAVAGRVFTGFGRIVAWRAEPRVFAGTVREISLGTLALPGPEDRPGSDLNGNGILSDTLVVFVARAMDGWVVVADTDGDGSLADETAVHDYRVAPETFGWHPDGAEPPMTLAANFSESDGRPRLTLVFDNSGHGTHVAGIAAGHGMYGVDRFNGVAPGAQLLGLKIANNAHGGISTTGSIIRAMGYAIAFAAARQLPLVINLSFGVGNEREGRAHIDRVIDSLLAAHPDVVFTVSAGNDGPGLSTLGFPGSVERGITVGATFPLVFVIPPGVTAPLPDPVAFFSARGGELAKPDILAPGVAFSTVPRWDIGGERNLGTSMAAPHVAGLVALLLSARLQEDGDRVQASEIKRALTITARPVAGYTTIDDGAGVPEILQAYGWLRQHRPVAAARVEALQDGVPVGSAAFYPNGLAAGDSVQDFRVIHRGLPSRTLRLAASEPWLTAPATVEAGDSIVHIAVRYHDPALRRAGVYTGTVAAWGLDSLDGPLFTLVNTIVVPYAAGENIRVGPVRVAPGGVHRVFFETEDDRPFVVTVTPTDAQTPVLTSLHEPGGQPFRDGVGIPTGPGAQPAVYLVSAGDVVPGVYELDVIASPAAPARAIIEVVHAPIRIEAAAGPGRVGATVRNAAGGVITGVGSVRHAGVWRRVRVDGQGSDIRRVSLSIPAWARSVEIDVAMEPDAWNAFTDFGATLVDALGRIIERAPLNYARERLQVAVEPETDMAADLLLVPGFAAPASAASWSVDIDIRYYRDPAAVRAQPTVADIRFALEPESAEPLTIPAGTDHPAIDRAGSPLYQLVIEAGGRQWSRDLLGDQP